jgi:hypothetical protein
MDAVRDNKFDGLHIDGPESKHEILFFGYDLRQIRKGHTDYILPVRMENGQMGSLWYVSKNKLIT